MVLNTIDDNTTFWSPYYTVVENALAGFGIVSGCAISKGTGDWDIDVTAGTVFVTGTGTVSVSSGTVTLTAPGSDADMDAGESRIDLVTANNSGALAAVEGTAATNPDAPDVPANEVVLGFVVVANSDSTAADSDIVDTPTLSVTTVIQQDLYDRPILVDDYEDNKLVSRDDPDTTTKESGLPAEPARFFRPDNRFNTPGTFTVQATGGRAQVSHTGGGSDTFGGIQPVTPIGNQPVPMKILFKDVSFTDNDTAAARNRLVVGITDQDTSADSVTSGNGIFLLEEGGTSLRVVVGGSSNSTSVTNVNWSSNHDVAIVLTYNSSGDLRAALEVDGTELGSDATNPVWFEDYLAGFQVKDDTDTASGETAEVENIQVLRP